MALNYEEDIRIDESALDVEFLNHPRMFFKYCRHAENTKRQADYKKEELDVRYAELDAKIRRNPSRYGIDKIAEKAVANAILLDPSYRELSNALIEARYEAGIAQAAVRAFEQRKNALENLVRLHGSQYFAGPKIPRDLAWEQEERQKRANKTVGAAMQRKDKNRE